MAQPSPLFTLLALWRREPNPERACALCDALRERPALAAPVVPSLASEILEHHRESHATLVALARLQLATDHFEESIDVLVSAGRLDPTSRAPYRLLGEALLRRGDAFRATRLFEHAIKMPPRNHEDDDDAESWLRLANVLQRLQKARGEEGVAEEMLRRIPAPVEVHIPDEETEATEHDLYEPSHDQTANGMLVADRTPDETPPPAFDAHAAAAELEIQIEVDDDDFPTHTRKPNVRNTLDGQLDSLFEESVAARLPQPSFGPRTR